MQRIRMILGAFAICTTTVGLAKDLDHKENLLLKPPPLWSSRSLSFDQPRSATTDLKLADKLRPIDVGASMPVGVSGTTSAANDKLSRKWTILMADKTLYRTMRRWAQEADYQLLWQIDRDYPIEVGVAFDNTLREAVEQVMAGVALTDYPIQAVFNHSARVLRVVRHMDDGRK